MKTLACIAGGFALAAAPAALAGSVAMSNFDQVAQINALGGSVSQIGGAGAGDTLLQASDFGGSTGSQTGVDVSLPGWLFMTGVVLTDVSPSQVGNSAGVLNGSPTDLTFTTPGASGPDGTNGDGSVSMSEGDTFTGDFASKITALAGEDKDLFIFTNTDGQGRIDVELLLNGNVVDSVLNVSAVSGAAGSGQGGILIDVVDGTMFDQVRVTSTASGAEIDAIAARLIPLPSGAGLALLGLAGLGATRRRTA